MKFSQKIKKLLKNPYKLFVPLGYKGMLGWMKDETYLKLIYRGIIGKKLNLDNPQTFNEKLQWMKLYNRKPEYTMMVDKYAVREYIKEQLGEEFLIPLISVWDSPDEIDFDALPDQFVLKCNHNSGTGMCICTDKSKLDIEAVKEDLRKGLKEDYYATSREWPYKNVKRKIIAEKYMVDESGTELKDYKILCFNGEPKLIQMHSGRFSTVHTQDYYDTEWNRLEILQGCPMAEKAWDKPEFLKEMLELSKKLSEGIPHVRVDWYYVENHLYFGELTFFDASGFDEFEPDEYNTIIGSWITLPETKEQGDKKWNY